MPVFARKAAIGLVAALLLLAACQNASNSPSASSGGDTSSGPSPSEAAVSSPVATVPTDQLAFEGILTTCIDIPYPPQEFFDEQGNPTGADPDIANEIAKRLGLESRIENSVFSTIIEAVTGGKCDIIISAQNITADRLGQVNMIPYFQAGQAFVVAKGNPAGIHAELDLCGKKAAAETGTTEVDYVNGTGDYEGAGLNKKCADAGKAAVDMQQFEKDTDALLALSSGTVDAYFADSPVAGYYTVQQPDQFELSGVTVEVAQEGISVPKDKAELAAAVVAALTSMEADGTYLEILTKYGLEDGAVAASEMKVVTGS
ncbi:MAG TPA: ABC transporter substrate-binding protein [Methylomirabilota bacterium]|jgi:polar amino acid transport system substrate-binding protein|nr:ABC transporter substrate-binding protein [Methylomirabilota bacterium]